MRGRLGRHRQEVARFGLAGWFKRNLFWQLDHRVGLDVLCVGLLPAPVAGCQPGAPLVYEHCVAEEGVMLTAAADPVLRLNPAVVAARFANGDFCSATFHDGGLIAYNWYGRGRTHLPHGFSVAFPDDWVVNHDAFVHPAYRGRGVATEAWRVTDEAFAADGTTHILSFVKASNIASIRAMNKNADTRWVGYVVTWRGLGRRRAFATIGCRRLGIRAEMPVSGSFGPVG